MMTATPTMIQAMTYMGLGFCDMDANSVQPLEDGKWRTVRQRILGAFHSAFASITTAISGWREKNFHVNSRTTAIPLHGLVLRFRYCL
jgi:hypothetical protein